MPRSSTAIFFAIVGALAGCPAVAASFDCSNASKLNASETIICNNQALSELDTKLAEQYRAAVQKLSDEEKAKLKAEQLAWIKSRNTCPDAECIAQAYKSRSESLSVIKVDEPTSSAPNQEPPPEAKSPAQVNASPSISDEKPTTVNTRVSQSNPAPNAIRQLPEPIKERKNENGLVFFMLAVCGVPWLYTANKWRLWKFQFDVGVAQSSSFLSALGWTIKSTVWTIAVVGLTLYFTRG